MHPRLWNDDVAATVRRMVVEQGFRMLYLNPSLHKFWLPIKTPSEGAGARKLLYPIFEAARELNIPVMIHSGEQPYALPATIDFVAGAFPDVNIIIAHLGTQGELYTIEALLVADRHPNVYLETSWAMPHMIIEAIHEVGRGPAHLRLQHAAARDDAADHERGRGDDGRAAHRHGRERGGHARGAGRQPGPAAGV